MVVSITLVILALTSLVGTTFFAIHRPRGPVETLVDCTRSKVSFDRLTPSDVTIDRMIDVCPRDELTVVIPNDSSLERVAVDVESWNLWNLYQLNDNCSNETFYAC